MDLAAEFPLREDIAYLNHAGVSPWPRRTAEAVRRFAEENAVQGSLDFRRWLDTEALLRDQLRQLLNAPSTDDIALVKSTSEGLSIVAYGLDWRAGDNIVISDQEFPSNRIVWQSLHRFGVEVRRVDLREGPDPEDAMLAHADARTRLLAVSSVQYASGLRMDLHRLGQGCRERSILFCVDAIQSLGAMPMDVQAIGADFLAADGHKWMLGPEGLGVFYCRAGLRDELSLNQFGWHMVENLYDFDQTEWEPAHSGRRFECGSPNMMGIHALSASLSLLLEVGPAPIESAIRSRVARLVEAITDDDRLQLLSPEDPQAARAGIVNFRPSAGDAEALWKRLVDRGVVCAFRGGGVRFSPHFYTPLPVLDRTMALVDEYLRNP